MKYLANQQLDNVRKTNIIFYLVLICPVKEKSLRVRPQNNWSDNCGVLEVEEKNMYINIYHCRKSYPEVT